MPIDSKKMTKAELEKLGVKLIPTDVYHVGPYKYSNLNDALAEAVRSGAKHKNKTFWRNRTLKNF